MKRSALSVFFLVGFFSNHASATYSENILEKCTFKIDGIERHLVHLDKHNAYDSWQSNASLEDPVNGSSFSGKNKMRWWGRKNGKDANKYYYSSPANLERVQNFEVIKTNCRGNGDKVCDAVIKNWNYDTGVTEEFKPAVCESYAYGRSYTFYFFDELFSRRP